MRVNNGQDLLDHGTLKSGVSHKWFDKSSWLIEWFLHADSDWIVYGLRTSLLCILSTAIVLAKNVLLLVLIENVLELGFPKRF